MQTPPHSFDDAARGSTTSPEADFAEAERLRKQRELKRKSRERKKRDLAELQETAAALEAQYSALLAAKVQRAQEQAADQAQPLSPTESRLATLKENYMALRDEVHELRDQMAGFKLKIDEYERFIATLDGQLLLVFNGAEQETREARPTT